VLAQIATACDTVLLEESVVGVFYIGTDIQIQRHGLLVLRD